MRDGTRDFVFDASRYPQLSFDTDIVFVRTSTPCDEAVGLMLKHDVEGVPVFDQTDAIVGMITQNTILRKLE